MFDDRKVKYDVVYLSDDDVHLNKYNGAEGWAWYEVRMIARYAGVEDVQGVGRVHIYSRDGESVEWVFKYYEALREGAKDALFAKLEAIADQFGLDELIDPYDGDPRNEIADLADKAWFDNGGACAEYNGDGLTMKLTGRVEQVLTILRAAHEVAEACKPKK
jgi:hypothetical protein